MKKSILLLFITLTLLSCNNRKVTTTHPSESQDDPIFLFSYFKDNGDGLHLAYSTDGLKWEALNNDSVYLKPQLGKDKLMRDPSIAQGSDGTFHIVWTTGWWDQGIGYASSRDLKTWSEQKNIPVMQNHPSTRNAWAPELFYDKNEGVFYIIWASTVPEEFSELPGQDKKKRLNHRQFYVTTRDFETFSETKVHYDPGFLVIDGAILQSDSLYYYFIKNEDADPAEKNIRWVANNKPYDFPLTVSDPITGDYWAEGPSPIQIGEYVYVYFDKYKENNYGAVRSKDMENWEDISELITFPKGAKHGTAFKVTKEIFNNLKQ